MCLTTNIKTPNSEIQETTPLNQSEMSSNMEQLVSRLEAVTNRLEAVASRGGGSAVKVAVGMHVF